MRNTLIPTTIALLAACLLSPSAAAGPPRYFITVETEGSGTVALEPDKPEGYQKNNIVTLTASPGSGSYFAGWSGDLSGTGNPATLRVSGDHLVLATFKEALV